VAPQLRILEHIPLHVCKNYYQFFLNQCFLPLISACSMLAIATETYSGDQGPCRRGYRFSVNKTNFSPDCIPHQQQSITTAEDASKHQPSPGPLLLPVAVLRFQAYQIPCKPGSVRAFKGTCPEAVACFTSPQSSGNVSRSATVNESREAIRNSSPVLPDGVPLLSRSQRHPVDEWLIFNPLTRRREYREVVVLCRSHYTEIKH
jgi:hypothetical protein